MHSLLAILLLGLPLLVTTTNGDEHIYIYDCPGNTSYKPGSAFQANLDALLASLPSSAAASSGFATNTTGAAPDQVYGLAQCRGDENASDCLACLDATVRDVASKCQAKRSAMVIYEACQLRYSDESFFSVYDLSFSVSLCSWRIVNATSPDLYDFQLHHLLFNLTVVAAYKSPRMFAAGAVQDTPSSKLYAMIQCTRDISADDCNRCINSIPEAVPYYCDTKQSIWLFRQSCSVRVDVYEFYDAQAVEAAMARPPPPPALAGGTHASSARRRANHSDAVIKVARCMISLLLVVILAI